MTTVPALIRGLHAAGWHHNVWRTWEHNIHRWRRDGQVVTAWMDSCGLDGHLLYEADETSDRGQVVITREWINRHGLTALHELAAANNLFGAPAFTSEDAAWRPRPPGWVERPAPVGSWWHLTNAGVAQIDGDYFDGAGDQIITYVLHRPDGSSGYGKWGGREFADAYTRLDGPPAWCTASDAASVAATS